MNTIEKALDEAGQHTILTDLVARLRKIWEQNGMPDSPDGTSTHTHGPALATPDDMGSEASEDDADNYNALIFALYACIDMTHIGSGLWHTQYERGSDAWQAYSDAAETMITEYVTHDMWEDWCKEERNQ